jgi:hypothetical protein
VSYVSILPFITRPFGFLDAPVQHPLCRKQWIDGSAGDHYFRGSTAEKRSSVGTGRPSIGKVSEEEMWRRIEYFLRELVPVAEAAGVRLAAHPNDPPVPEMRGVASILYKPEKYRAPYTHFRHFVSV